MHHPLKKPPLGELSSSSPSSSPSSSSYPPSISSKETPSGCGFSLNCRGLSFSILSFSFLVLDSSLFSFYIRGMYEKCGSRYPIRRHTRMSRTSGILIFQKNRLIATDSAFWRVKITRNMASINISTSCTFNGFLFMSFMVFDFVKNLTDYFNRVKCTKKG